MLHENLRLKRKERGLSQEELASRLHVVRQTISKWEKGMSVPDSEQLIKIAVILETTVSELLGTKVENEEEPDRLAKELSRINTQLAIRNHRTRRVLKIIAVALLVFVALIFAIMALNYVPMSQSKYTKRDALLLPNRTDVISVSVSCDNEREAITDKREIDDLFANLSTVRIKSGESYNDAPMTDKFIKIFFEVSDGLSGCVVYVFEDENGFFIEQPYNGIFSIEEKQYTEIFGLFFRGTVTNAPYKVPAPNELLTKAARPFFLQQTA